MRLFTGLDVPTIVESELDRFLQPLRETAPGFRWSPLANLHITTKFIGEFPDARLPELKRTLGAIGKPGPITIPVRGVGWFPNPHRPRALFATFDSPQTLHDLASATQAALAALGVEREDRKYTPHLTLARLDRVPAQQLGAVRQAIARQESLDFGVIEAKSFYLYFSRPESKGSIYTKLAEFPFQ